METLLGPRHDATASIIESAVAPCLVAINVLPALTFENGQPVITADFVDTLNLDPAAVLQVNQILQNMRQEYLAVEKEQLGKIKVTQDPDGTKHFVVPPLTEKSSAALKPSHNLSHGTFKNIQVYE